MMKARTSNTRCLASQCWLRPGRSSQPRFSTSNVSAGKEVSAFAASRAPICSGLTNMDKSLLPTAYATIFSRQHKRFDGHGIFATPISLPPHAGRTDGQ